LDFDTTGLRVASLDEFVAMTIVGLVVEIDSKDFNVASVLSSVDRQLNTRRCSFQISVKNLVVASRRDTSGLDVDSAGQKWRGRSPLTVDHMSLERGDGVGAVQVLEVLCQISSFGISWISGERSEKSD